MARGVGRAGRYTLNQTRRATHAEGAGETGLYRLIELHAFSNAGDAAVAISLAGTLFFQVPTGEARGQVALFLGMTMLPFTIVAPLIGPFLDRFSHGRRWAIGATFALRAFLAWVLAGVVSGSSPTLFAAALGCLVASKAYGIARSAAVPRMVPASQTLVKANGRISLAGVVGAAVSAPLAALAGLAGPAWSLRYAFVLFVIGTVLAILLPPRVDSAKGEGTLAFTDSAAPGPTIPPAVAYALRACAGARWTTGFLTMFMAFLLRTHPIDDYRSDALLALVVGGAGLGSSLGVMVASLVKNVNPRVTVTVALIADAVMAGIAAGFYGIVTIVALGLTAGFASSLAKLSLDSTIQQDVPERVRTSALARSDTLLQVAWVIGGFVGIAIPLQPVLGLGVACALLTAWLMYVLSRAR